MPYVDPDSVQDAGTGDVVVEALLQNYRDNFEYVARNHARCRVNRSSVQSIPNSALTAIAFPNEDFDSGGMHSTGSNTSRITVPSGQGGVYYIGGFVVWGSNNTGQRFATILKNSVTQVAIDRRQALGASECTLAVMDTANAGDYYELAVLQDSGGALDVASGVKFFAKWMAL